MALLVIGGDRIDTRRLHAGEQGSARVHHWSGRKPGDCHRRIPDDMRLVMIFIDYVNHGLARRVRRLADDRGLPIIFSKRSASSLENALRSVDAASTAGRPAECIGL